jgi:hypothetical protein
MKKLLFVLGLISFALYTQAQTTLFSQNFEATTTSIPAGWSHQGAAADPSNGGWEFNNHYGTKMQNNGHVALPTHNGSYCAFVDDWDNNLGTWGENKDTLYTNSFSTTGQNTVFLSLDYMFWNDAGAELGTVAISVNGGAWQTAVTFTDGGGLWADSSVFDISSIAANQANVRLAFTYDDGYSNAAAQTGYVAVGMCVDNIRVFTPVAYDLSVTSQNLPPIIQSGVPHTLSGSLTNFGATAVTSMKMHYTVNGAGMKNQPISSVNIATFANYNWSMPSVQFTPPSAGTYNLKIWADSINGTNADQNNGNDTIYATFLAADTIAPRQALMEEFTGQSCVWCMIAGPNVDSVSNNNATKANIIKYHVPIPGRDFMYNVTSSQINTRMSYYSVNSAPSAFLDGVAIDPSGYGNPPPDQHYSSTTISNDNTLGSPFQITITSASCNFLAGGKESFSLQANIKSYAPFPSGIKAQVVLTEDELGYHDDLSQDDPTISFAPPIGSDNNPGDFWADTTLYPYVLNFHHVAEDMLPGTSGTTLTAFTTGSTQTINVSWTKNHPWGQFPNGGGSFNSWGTVTQLGDSTEYDSTKSVHFIVFLQTDAGITSAGIPAKYIFQSASSSPVLTGLQQIENSDAYFKMYPNPTNSTTHVEFVLQKDQNISIEVYNMLGENVSSINEGKLSVGSHVIPIDGSNLPSGIYVVRFIADNNASATSKLVIQK